MPSEKPTSRCSENRRCNKPIMEKRRRARINSCLNDLKALILEALKKDPARHSKLEKADILEMTVKHLQNLQRQQAALSAAANPQVTNKFRAGFNECAEEVSRFVVGHHGLDNGVRQRLLGHLANCTNRLGVMQTLAMQQRQSYVPNLAMMTDDNSSLDSDNPATTSGIQQQQHPPHQALFRGLQLVPTRLPNGDLALLLPANYSSNYIHSNNEAMTSPTSTVAPDSPMRPATADSQLDDAADHSRHFHSRRHSTAHSLSGSSIGTASPSPPPPPSSGTRPAQMQQLSVASDVLGKREPHVTGMVERFRDECRTGSRLPPWATNGHHDTHSDILYREDGDREPWRPW